MIAARHARRGATLLLAMAVATSYACGKKAGPTDPVPPGWPPPTPVTLAAIGFPPMPIPGDNPTTREGIALGRLLYYDPILSGDSTQSCASCHEFGRAFSDDRRFSVGIDGIAGTRNAPAIVNPGWLPSAFWDGRVPTLEAQAMEPVANPIEMHADWNDVVARLQRHAQYPDRFGRAFGSSTVTTDRVVKAIAQFERTFISNQSRYDRFVRNEIQLSPMESRGMGLFFTEKADCFHCHGNLLATDNRFHNVGVDPTNSDPGLMAVTGRPEDAGKFKTPTLRNVAFSAPYMHDGRFATLRDVVNHYNDGVSGVPNLDPLIRPAGVGLGMTPAEIDTLIAFLLTLTDSTFVNDTSRANPFTGPAPR